MGDGDLSCIEESVFYPVERDVSCVWKFDPDGYWETGCGEAFQITEGSPTENKMLFCYHCGHPLKEKQ